MAVTKDAHRINFEQFTRLLHLIGEKRGMTFDDLAWQMLQHEGPEVFSSSPAGLSVHLHDDRSTWTSGARNGLATEAQKTLADFVQRK